MKNILFILFTFIYLVGFKVDRNRTITGVVTDGTTALAGVMVVANNSKAIAVSDANGKFSLGVGTQDTELMFRYIGYEQREVKLSKQNMLSVVMTASKQQLNEVTVAAYEMKEKKARLAAAVAMRTESRQLKQLSSMSPRPILGYAQPLNQESYATINENGFHSVKNDPLSTFSIDVDAAAYSNVRRYIRSGSLPPADAVRIEEMINYFDYSYTAPTRDHPVNIITDVAPAPWNPAHKLVQIALQAKKVSTEKLPASNLVFLIDVSGSMASANKLPLLISSLKLLTNQLRAKDKVSIVVYAGSSGVVLPPTSGDAKIKIKEALERLQAGGSTAGGEGIELAYKIANENFIKGGNNRVILATDGDFNVGPSSDNEMERLIENKRKSNIFLTVLGYGMGNYKDSKMELLADKGNGNYAYVDDITEARKVLVNEFGGTLFTVAKDVKLQVEFNPGKVQAYRLIGYENRLLNKEDFNDDKKDAGEIGSGHTVTALYEIIPAGIKDDFSGSVDELKYQKTTASRNDNAEEILTVKLRYKEPSGLTSKLLTKAIKDKGFSMNEMSDDFRFSASVAAFGMLLRDSKFKQNATFDQVIALAEKAKGTDREGYRSEFISLVKSAKLLANDLLSQKRKHTMDENK
ncbi:YfbK domain-containing protein [Pedobacter sp. MW01-1-1]|uniref:YfbK domain-containing protein n=1 Tax=Pedobacter sp. MW01-1-1 TaxID=3383027 RepID=UPI003FF0B80D